MSCLWFRVQGVVFIPGKAEGQDVGMALSRTTISHRSIAHGKFQMSVVKDICISSPSLRSSNDSSNSTRSDVPGMDL